MKSLLGADSNGGSSLGSKVAAGMLSGALAAGVSNPTDLVKTHMQKGGSGSGGGPFTVMARVVKAEGVRGLWVGTTPSMVRGRVAEVWEGTYPREGGGGRVVRACQGEGGVGRRGGGQAARAPTSLLRPSLLACRPAPRC